MSTLVEKSSSLSSPVLSKKGTPKKTKVNKENPSSGTPTGKLRHNFKIFNDVDSSTKKTTTPKNSRRSLAPIQLTAGDENVLTGRNVSFDAGKDCEKILKIDHSELPVVEVKEPENLLVSDALALLHETEGIHVSQQEEQEQEYPTDSLVTEALAIMKATEVAGDDYWKELAEERRLALEETLDENDKLYDEIDELKKQNEEIKKKLSEMECYKMLYLSGKNEEAE